MLRYRRVNPDILNRNTPYQHNYLDRFLTSISKLTLAVIFALVVYVTQSDAANRSIVIHHNYSNLKHKRSNIRHHRVVSSSKLSPRRQRVSSGNRLKNQQRTNRKYHYSSGSYRQFNHYGTGHYGPLIINIPRVLRKRGTSSGYQSNYITESDENLTRHELQNGGVFVNSRPRAAYYNEKKCNNGGTCVIRMGARRNSPKVIIVGKNQNNGDRPIVIRAPE